MEKKIKMLLIYYWNVSFQRVQGVVEHSILSVLACLLRFEKITIVFACLFNKIPKHSLRNIYLQLLPVAPKLSMIIESLQSELTAIFSYAVKLYMSSNSE